MLVAVSPCQPRPASVSGEWVEGERTQGPREGRCNGILSIKQSNPRGQVEPGIERAKINDACGVKASFKDTDEETSRYQSRLST